MVPRNRVRSLARALWVGAVIGIAATLDGCVVAGGAMLVAASQQRAQAAVGKVAVPIRPEFDRRDQGPHDAAFANAMSGAAPAQTAHWDNPTTGDSGTIEATAIGSGNSQPCRQVVETYLKSGQTYNGSSRFCRSGNADWEAVEG